MTVATLREPETASIVAQAFHFPLGRHAALQRGDASVALDESNGRWSLRIGADRLLQSMHIDCPGFLPSDNWFHLAPGEARVVDLVRTDGPERPAGDVNALNLAAPASF